MRYFDENCVEIFLYRYIVGEYDISYEEHFWSYRKVEYEEFQLAKLEYETERDRLYAIKDAADDAWRKYINKKNPDLEKAQQLRDIVQLAIEECNKFEGFTGDSRYRGYVGWLMKKFDLKELECDGI